MMLWLGKLNEFFPQLFTDSFLNLWLIFSKDTTTNIQLNKSLAKVNCFSSFQNFWGIKKTHKTDVLNIKLRYERI